VLRLLDDPKWAAWSDREIARRCGVGADMVGKLRPPPLSVSDSEPVPTTYTTKHSTVAQMNVSRIGSALRLAPAVAVSAPAPQVVSPAPTWTPADIPASVANTGCQHLLQPTKGVN